jgi:hypothetical protein
MAPWRITSEAPGWIAQWPGWDVEFVWSWPIERQGLARTVSVGVANGSAELSEIADESRQAVVTFGRSAVMAVLDREDPPRRIAVTTTGLREESD